MSTTRPEVGRSRPAISPSNVDFPDPELPVIASVSPAATDSDIVSSMAISPEESLTLRLSCSTLMESTSCMQLHSIFSVMTAWLTALVLNGHALAGESPGTWRDQDPSVSRDGTPLVLVVGDSLSAEYGLQRGTGWVHHINRRLQDSGSDWSVHNSSVSGDTTAGGLARLPHALAEHTPAIVVIELGGNDALRGLALDATRANLARMITLSHDAGACVLLIGMQIPPNYGRRYAERFAGLFASLAEEYQTRHVPFLMHGFATDPAYFQADGIHPNERAQTRMADTVEPPLAALMQDARAGRCPADAVPLKGPVAAPPEGNNG